jgi:flagellar hook-associated protein 2
VVSLNGLASGLDINGIISGLMSVERTSVTRVMTRQDDARFRLDSYGLIRTKLAALRSATFGLTRPTDWLGLAATSSNENAVGVSAGSGSYGGTLSFTVNRLATAGSVRSLNTIASPATLVAADDAILVAAGGRRLGFEAIASDDALPVGAHTLEVTQSSAAAAQIGSPLAPATTIDGTNNTLEVTVDGAAKTLTVAAGTYDPEGLAAAVQAAADAAGAAVTVSVDGASGGLRIATAREGSAATLQVGNGTANAALGLNADASARTGSDGRARLDSGAEITFSDIVAGGNATLTSDGGGTVTVTFSGGLRAGTLTAQNVSTGDGSLAAVVAAINGASAGVSAAAVQVGVNAYRLQITATQTGALNGPSIAASEFGSAVGSLVTVTAAQDSRVTVGTGPGAYTIDRESNVLTNVLPGSTITLKQTTVDPVTVTLRRDGTQLADRVDALVTALNDVLDSIREQTKYDADKSVAGPLLGDSAVRSVAQRLVDALIGRVAASSYGSGGSVGIQIDREGKVTFDKAKFANAFAEKPDQVAGLFAQGGAASDNGVRFVSAGARARPGTYAVTVTRAAEQAVDTGLTGGWPIVTAPTVRVRVGDRVVEYEVKGTDGAADVADGLNAAFAASGLALRASAGGGGVEIRSSLYGSDARFDVAWDGTTYTTHRGVDLAGTIDGVAATGSGRQLVAPFDNGRIGGLAVEILDDTLGARGTLTYSPGIAQRLATAVNDAVDLSGGVLTSTEKATRTRIDYLQKEIDRMNARLSAYEARLRAQFTAMETTLGSLRSQGTWLTGQITALQNATKS